MSNRAAILRWIALMAALGLLNAALTFANVWPTLGVRWTGDLSIEVAACVLALVIAYRWLGAPSRAVRRGLAVLWVLLAIGRYIDVTSRSLYGRDINLYWDLQYIPDVSAMFTAAAHPWLPLGLMAATVLIPVLVYLPLRWAFGRVGDATNDRRARRALGTAAAALLLMFAARALDADVPEIPRFAEPVSATYVREASELVYEMSGAGVRTLPPPAQIRSNLARVRGADVLLVFLESYGAVSWDRPAFVEALTVSRARLDADIRETGRGVVSAFAESTTFGGESWLAHISLLTGTEVRDQARNVRLMAQPRDTLVKMLRRHGYRTVAIMPGLQRSWPEGAFYGFDNIYGALQLDYRGPPFGWWSITDQYALARVDAREVAPQAREPVFVFFPTISTHAPFTPAPPYQPDWGRVLTATPHDQAELDRAWSDQADWMNLAPSYVKALEYVHATLGGYLRLRADRDLVMILVGDHQPPALVSGEGASWDVPVHVIASRRALLGRLRAHGFREGLAPRHPRVAHMHTLLPILLDAFGDGE